MELPEQVYATLHATPRALVGWLHTVAATFADALANTPANAVPDSSHEESLQLVLLPAALRPTLIFIAGPHTFRAEEPAPFETLALYIVDSRKVHDIAARQVVLAVTYMPLRQPEIGLDLRVWPSFPAALDALTYQFADYFTQASPVLSSAAALYVDDNQQVLACNRWLLAKLDDPAYADRRAAKQLYPAWLEQYRALKGAYPADPRRAFRALLAHPQRRKRKQ